MSFIFNTEADISVLYVLAGLCFCDVLSGASFIMHRQYMSSEWYEEGKAKTKITKKLPSWLFAVVWPILYVLIITALDLVITRANAAGAFGRDLDVIALAFLFNVFLNKLWSPVYFVMQMPWVALALCFSLNVTNALVAAYMWIGGYYTSFWVYFPYLLWCVFAFILNAEWCYAEKKTKRRKDCPPEIVQLDTFQI